MEAIIEDSDCEYLAGSDSVRPPSSKRIAGVTETRYTISCGRQDQQPLTGSNDRPLAGEVLQVDLVRHLECIRHRDATFGRLVVIFSGSL